MKASSNIVFTGSSDPGVHLISLKLKVTCLHTHALSPVCFSGPQQHHPHRLWLQEGIHLLGGLNQADRSKDQQNAPQWEWPQGTSGFSHCDCLCHFLPKINWLYSCALPVQLGFMKFSFFCPAFHTVTLSHLIAARSDLPAAEQLQGQVSGGNDGGAGAVFHFPPLRSISHIWDMKQRSTSQKL